MHTHTHSSPGKKAPQNKIIRLGQNKEAVIGQSVNELRSSGSMRR